MVLLPSFEAIVMVVCVANFIDGFVEEGFLPFSAIMVGAWWVHGRCMVGAWWVHGGCMLSAC